MVKICLIFLFIQVLVVISALDSATNTLELVNEAQKKLKLSNNSNIILVIGNTGSGKSTLVHYVAGDPSKIISKNPKNQNDADFEIEDGLDVEKGTSISSTVSRTFVPEMVVDVDGYVWYDCPGFHDTRNETMEIATTFLIRSVVGSASLVKVVLVVDYESVTKGHSRTDFDELLTHTIQLLKRFDKFKSSVSLVITKAPPQGRRNVDISENNVKNTTAQFMKDHRAVLHVDVTRRRKIELIDALLKTSNEDYDRLSVFWRPDDVGTFDELPKLAKGHHLIRTSILQHTEYTPIQPDDFGFPLTAEAQLHITSMVQQLMGSIKSKLRNITDNILADLRRKIQSKGDFRQMFDQIEIGQERLQYPQGDVQIVLRNLTDRFRGIIIGSELQSIDVTEFIELERDENNFNTFQSILKEATVNGNEAPANIDYKLFLDEINDFFKKCEIDTQNSLMSEAQQTIQNITTDLVSIDTRLLMAIKDRLLLTRGLYDKYRLLELANSASEQGGSVANVADKMKRFSNLINALNITSVRANELNRIEQHVAHLRELKSILKSKSKQEIAVPHRDWIEKSDAIAFLSTEYLWNSFLVSVYAFLASYNVQANLTVYNVAELSDWQKPNRPQGLSITSDNFAEFTQQMLGKSLELESTPSRLHELNDVIRTTIQSPPKYLCTDEEMTIEGIFVRSSDIKLSNCPSIKALKRINVFVVDRFYVDNDLNLNGFENVELHILANKWNIVQSTTFHLNGLNGVSHTTSPQTNGTAGKPGAPGMNSGNFFGVANEIVNGELLTVELIGGNGGDGQNGTGNEDVQVVQRQEASNDPRYSAVYRIYPSDYWTESFEFASASDTKVFNEWNPRHMSSTLSHLLGQEINYSRKILSGHCCGATGAGGFGGRGGSAGYYEFIQTGKNPANPPKNLTKDGTNGKSGHNARVCQTKGLIVQKRAVYYGFDENERIVLNSATKSHQAIDDPNCPVQYASNPEAISNPPAALHATRTMLEYKQFLRKNMDNPLLFNIIQNTNESI